VADDDQEPDDFDDATYDAIILALVEAARRREERDDAS